MTVSTHTIHNICSVAFALFTNLDNLPYPGKAWRSGLCAVAFCAYDDAMTEEDEVIMGGADGQRWARAPCHLWLARA